MKKQPRGYGLRCHRAIITICRLIGIKDMYAKVNGSVNMLNLTRGLFHGLARQKPTSIWLIRRVSTWWNSGRNVGLCLLWLPPLMGP